METRVHLRTAHEFLAASETYSETTAPLIMSEMLWCAAAHCVKGAANEYGWANVSHDDLFRAVRRLAQRTSEPGLAGGFQGASRLHKNMYEGHLHVDRVRRDAANVRRFVNRVTIILTGYSRLPSG